MPHNCKVRSFTDTSTGELRATCTCGWSYRGTKPTTREGWNTYTNVVASHRPPRTKEPPLKVEGFVSGLPEQWP